MPNPPEVARQLDVLLSGAAEVVPVVEFEAKLRRSLAEGRPLRVKLGIDPSAPDLHLGHAVVLRTLRRFQDLGHVAVLIVGDFTGRVGDPSGRSETRPMLKPEQLEANAQTYLDQAGTVLDIDRAEVRRNSEWLEPLGFSDVLRLATSLTVAQLLQREDFSNRFKEDRPISLVEFLYPLMQGYDSVAVRADVEMGGTDQLFNLMVGREVQRAYGMEPQVAFTMPLLPGTDGDRKMSKSYGNHIGLTEPPEEQFGKAMSISDELIPVWCQLCTDAGAEAVDALERGLADGSRHPAQEKRRLAREIVALYHGEDAARAAEGAFDARHKRHEIPDDVPAVEVRLADVYDQGQLLTAGLLVALGLASSKSDGRRMLEQAAVRARWPGEADERGERITADPLPLPADKLVGSIWSVGKRRFARVASIT